ncbi:MAG: type II toxin-antitoxin system RelE/ParE family toxin [Proteobacteria bacterium]|nr:type II toxin-antitoxin system RelE/ParE family toxin [Pseudomonadota bacterium]
MAKIVTWSNESLEDIEEIAEFISRDSIHHARRVISEIINIVETLQTQPKMGRIVSELNQENIREHFIYNYRIIYQIDNERLHILAVIHGGRLLENIDNRFTS